MKTRHLAVSPFTTGLVTVIPSGLLSSVTLEAQSSSLSYGTPDTVYGPME